MAIRTAKAEWRGALRDGRGTFQIGTGGLEGTYSFGSRFEDAKGSNPEELLGAAHAACFSMALANALTQAGHAPARIDTTAKVSLAAADGGFAINRIELHTEGEVSDIDEAEFQKHAEAAKTGCPVSKALAATKIDMTAKLVR